MLDSVGIDDRLPGLGVIVVRAQDGSELRYLPKNGILYPGRVWLAVAPSGHRVTFFLPFPDGQPEVLQVEQPQ